MSDARSKRLRDLSWPATCAFYTSNLNLELRKLIESAKRFAQGSTLPGYNLLLGERDLWSDVYGVQNMLRISFDIEKTDDPFAARLMDAEAWLGRLFAGCRMKDPRKLPDDASEHARRLSSPGCIQAFEQILALVPDPFDTPQRTSLQLFEWARFHLGVEASEWRFIEDVKLPEAFRAKWHEAIIDDEGALPVEKVIAIRKQLLIDARLWTGGVSPRGLASDPLSPQAAGFGLTVGTTPISELDVFWALLRQFLNVMLGYDVGRDSEPLNFEESISTGESIHITCPNGFAASVGNAIKRVDARKFPTDEAALFRSARDRFRSLVKRHGCTDDDEEMSMLRPAPSDDPDLVALKLLVTHRIPSQSNLVSPIEPISPPLPTLTSKSLDQPSEKAIQCYRLKFYRGDDLSQESIGKQVYGCKGKQSQVSRDLERVKAWISAGNVLPDMDHEKPKVFYTDPARLDRGPRRNPGRPHEHE